MKKFNEFFKTSIIGGIIVILPIVILFIVFSWLFKLVSGLIRPVTGILSRFLEIHPLFVDFLAIVLILWACFFVGFFVRTRFGKFLHDLIERHVLKIAPGYNMIKETILQLTGAKRAPFSTVVLAQIFENKTMVTAFLLDEHEDGTMTIFVPTAPNPTSGFIYHLNTKFVHPVNVTVEEAMRTIIGCGSGSAKLIEKYKIKDTGL